MKKKQETRLLGQEAINSFDRFKRKYRKTPEIAREVDTLIEDHIKWAISVVVGQLQRQLSDVQTECYRVRPDKKKAQLR